MIFILYFPNFVKLIIFIKLNNLYIFLEKFIKLFILSWLILPFYLNRNVILELVDIRDKLQRRKPAY